MSSMMKIAWAALICVLVAATGVFVVWLVKMPAAPLLTGNVRRTPTTAVSPASSRPEESGPALRIGLIPERNIFRQRRRYKALAGYLSRRLGRPVELVTARSYEGILRDFDEKRIEGAFLGSLVAVLAMDRNGARLTVRPELPGGVSTYHGVIFVRADSPFFKLEQLSGRSIAMVRTTTAGHLFPTCALVRLRLWTGPNRPRIVWMGTHDDVAMRVMAGDVDAGAIKNLRLDALTLAHPKWKIRRLAEGPDVPNNALLMRRDVPDDLAAAVTDILLKMDRDPRGRRALAAFGATRFIPCRTEEYAHVYSMIERIRPMWQQTGIKGPAPHLHDTGPNTRPGGN